MPPNLPLEVRAAASESDMPAGGLDFVTAGAIPPDGMEMDVPDGLGRTCFLGMRATLLGSTRLCGVSVYYEPGI